jgi:hypothetical protein
MADWKDILSGSEEPLSEEDLLKYLDQRTRPADKNAIENSAGDGFDKDALEGLKQIQNPEVVQKHVSHLKQKLHQQLSTKKRRKDKGKINQMQWTILTLLVLLFICISVYVFVRMLR